jgi:hypothetical protein
LNNNVVIAGLHVSLVLFTRWPQGGYPGFALWLPAVSARVRALNADQDFLNLWKDADPDIPVYKQAKSEYAKLR